ncbi:organic cation transporter protein-like isoform X1 [Mytilus edulis]|uniref:organic cation transporter protein-like isoform X1 n=1 Tax=Mytilus edulis TaxID=6550 RepID=UPI0039F04F92
MLNKEYDSIFQHLGGFGLYQKFQLLLLALPTLFDATTTMMLVFMLGDQPHRCRLPDVEDNVYSHPPIFHSDALNISAYNTSQCYLNINGTNSPCNDWVYDTTYYQSTLISKFNMVCQDKFMRSHILLSHFFGTFFNAIFCGLLCDVWGRKPMLILGIFLLIVPNVIRPWIPHLFLVAICEFLNATGSNLSYVVPFTMLTELVDPAHRVLASFTIYMAYCIGCYVLLVYAYFIRDWETLIQVVSVPITICLFVMLFVPESPRWLLLKGRTKEAMTIFKRTAKFNKTKVDFNPEDITVKEGKRLSFTTGFKIMFKSKPMMGRFFILMINWFAISLIYYGISMNTGDLGGNVYANYAVSTTAETVAVLLCFYADKLPRKKIYCTAMILGSTACLSTIFTSMYASGALHWVTIGLAMIGKLGVTTAFFLIYLITSECFPTVIRASMFGLCSSGARIGSMSSSYIGKLGVLIDTKFGTALPLIIVGSVGTLAGILSLLLPETRNTELPETFEEALHIESNTEDQSPDSSESNIEMLSVKDEKCRQNKMS